MIKIALHILSCEPTPAESEDESKINELNKNK